MLKGKTVLITGASRGIGYATAEAFLKEGANAALCAVKEESLIKAKEDLLAKYPSAKIFIKTTDVSDEAQVKDFVDGALKEFGAIDVLVNNAGITKDALVIRMSQADWDAVLNINLKGAFLMSKACAKEMMKARSGAIVNITSVVGQTGNAGQANYAAAKAGLIGLAKTLAKELAPRNIRVNAVAPGFVDTEMTQRLPQEIKEAALGQIPLKRFARADDIAQAVLFLASDKAAYITGQVIAVNGGLYI